VKGFWLMAASLLTKLLSLKSRMAERTLFPCFPPNHCHAKQAS